MGCKAAKVVKVIDYYRLVINKGELDGVCIGDCYFVYIFLAFPNDPRKALGEAILAGGDTDTIGSMVGGLIGTLNGAGIWPDHLATNVQDYENLLVIADSFAKTCFEVYSKPF